MLNYQLVTFEQTKWNLSIGIPAQPKDSPYKVGTWTTCAHILHIHVEPAAFIACSTGSQHTAPHFGQGNDTNSFPLFKSNLGSFTTTLVINMGCNHTQPSLYQLCNSHIPQRIWATTALSPSMLYPYLDNISALVFWTPGRYIIYKSNSASRSSHWAWRAFRCGYSVQVGKWLMVQCILYIYAHGGTASTSYKIDK